MAGNGGGNLTFEALYSGNVRLLPFLSFSWKSICQWINDNSHLILSGMFNLFTISFPDKFRYFNEISGPKRKWPSSIASFVLLLSLKKLKLDDDKPVPTPMPFIYLFC